MEKGADYNRIIQVTPFLRSGPLFRAVIHAVHSKRSAIADLVRMGTKLMKWSASRLHFAHLMHDFVIEGNTQSAVQGNSWQDWVNALVMLLKATQSMHGLSLNYHKGCPPSPNPQFF